MTAPPIPPPVADPRTPHLDLPLPAPDANAMRTDAARIAAAIALLDDHAAAVDGQIEAMATDTTVAQEISLLKTQLGNKADATTVAAALAAKADAAHAHAVNDVTGLQTALDGKAAASLINVSNTDFAGKAAAAGVGGGFKVSGIVTISGNTSITQETHAGKALRVTATAALTFPAAASFVGAVVIYNGTGAAITLTSASGINGSAQWVVLGGQSAIVVGDGTQYLATSGGPALTWLTNFTPGGIAYLASLSSDAMTATAGAAGWYAARTAALPTSAVYFEMHIVGKGGDEALIGVDASTYDGGSGTVVAGRTFLGHVMTSAGYGSITWSAVSVGTVVGIAISPDNKMWMAHNNAWVGSPSAGTSPSWIGLPASRAAVFRGRYNGDAVRLVFAAGQMAYSAPAGFAAIQS